MHAMYRNISKIADQSWPVNPRMHYVVLTVTSSGCLKLYLIPWELYSHHNRYNSAITTASIYYIILYHIKWQISDSHEYSGWSYQWSLKSRYFYLRVTTLLLQWDMFTCTLLYLQYKKCNQRSYSLQRCADTDPTQ